MSFQLETSTKAKIVDISVLSQKNRPADANPGVSLAFSIELPNTALTMFDGFMRSALYTKDASTETPPQATLAGVEPVSDLPNLSAMGRKIKAFGWDLELTGYTLTFDFGLGGKSNLVVSDCKLDDFHIQAKEGGTIILKLKAEANDIDEAVFGKLATLKSRDVQILLAPPEVDMGDESKTGAKDSWPFPDPDEKPAGVAPVPAKKAKGKTASEAFVEAHGA